MNTYRLSATLLSPLAVKRDRQSERSEGVRSLSGTLVRGALAAAFLRCHGKPDDRFNSLFLDETAARFGPLDPAEATVPLTAVSCKREPGFLANGKHGVADLLWPRAALALGAPGEQFQAWRACRVCKHDLKPHAGWWQPGSHPRGEKGNRRGTATHVGIDGATGTAATGMLYSLEAIQPESGSEFVGTVALNESARETLQDLLASEDEVYFGHHRTRGYGRVRLELNPNPLSVSGDVERREKWSAELAAFVKKVKGQDLGSDFLFGLTFPAGAILLDQVLRYAIDPADSVTWLPSLNGGFLRVEGGELSCLAAVTKQERVRGWNAAHGLPRQDEWSLSRGCAFAYRYTGSQAGRQELHNRLTELEREGLGVRRNEGFGAVTVSDEFHRYFHNQEV